jgi:hypothetical protein
MIAVLVLQLLLGPDPLDVADLPAPDGTKTHMRSGFDYNDANYDSGNLFRVEPAGKPFSDPATEWVLFDRPGPGVITSIWFTGKNKQGGAWIGGRLNFYFDGESRASITGPLPEIFEEGRVFPAPLAEKSSGGWVSYLPIYYARSLKVTISEHGDGYTHRRNGRGENIPHLYHQFTYQDLPHVERSGASPLKNWTWRPQGSPQRFARRFAARGRGVVEELRLTEAPDAARVRVTADGKTTVDLTVAELLGFSRQARPEARFRSLLLGLDEAGAVYLRFPMPYRRNLRIETPGAAEIRVRSGWPAPEQFYFRAQTVQDVTEPRRDIYILKTQGRGHFVGTILELHDKTMEGDDRFYVDDEPFPPSWHGTGTEDYFRCGWYFFGGPLTRPLYGMLDARKPTIAYRFHLADRVNWRRSARIGFEHGHANEYLGPFRGVVFWYSEN